MFDPVTATLGAAAIGGGLNYLASEDASRRAGHASEASMRQQLDMFNRMRADLAPYMATGAGATSRLSALLPGLTSNFTYDPNQDPSTMFRFGMGREAVDASAAARGGYFSGATGRALTDYGQGFASTEYQNAFLRDQAQKQNIYNILSGTASMGESAAAGVGSTGVGVGTNIGATGLNVAGYQGGLTRDLYGGFANDISSGKDAYLRYLALNPGGGGTPAAGTLGGGWDWSATAGDYGNWNTYGGGW